MPSRGFDLFPHKIDNSIKDRVENAQDLNSCEIELSSSNTVNFVVIKPRHCIVSLRQLIDCHRITRYRKVLVWISGELSFYLSIVSCYSNPSQQRCEAIVIATHHVFESIHGLFL